MDVRAYPGASAAILPFSAIYVSEVIAMPRKRPAVVQGPLHAAVMRGEPLEQHLDVHIVAVEVVQVYHVGLELVQASEQAPRRRLGVEPSLAVKAGL